MPQEQTVILYVEATPKQDRLISYIRGVDLTSLRLQGDHLKFKTNHHAFNLRVIYRYPELEAMILSSHVKSLNFYRSSERRWKVHLRLAPHVVSLVPDGPVYPEGVMGLDVGSRSHLSMFWVKNGQQGFHTFNTGKELDYDDFKLLAAQVYDCLSTHRLHTLRIEALSSEDRFRSRCPELLDYIRTYVHLASADAIRVEAVSPLYTSQSCPRCRHIASQLSPTGVYTCRACGYTLDRDLLAAQNIQRGGCVPQEKAG
ncbi:transposase [Deinococcus sp. 6YEL10]|uniref:transposase n=1 Tax=Deinococcus sp. 6YEL10 TaxID=2745870 RepID=UPI001E461B55|nr:transposase [Deinococcus sp. 6YEL10]MCD0159805.1 transposase [Deinococcus sp. 6YEL10]